MGVSIERPLKQFFVVIIAPIPPNSSVHCTSLHIRFNQLIHIGGPDEYSVF